MLQNPHIFKLLMVIMVTCNNYNNDNMDHQLLIKCWLVLYISEKQALEYTQGNMRDFLQVSGA